MTDNKNDSKKSLKTKEQFLSEADELHQRFVQNLVVKKIDVASVSIKSKIPFKALVLRESLYYRVTELSGVAIELYRQSKMTSAVIITRAVFESAALCYYIYKNLETVTDTGFLSEIDNILMKASHGSLIFSSSYPLKPFRPSIIIEELNKEHHGTKDRYSFLCELTHPNWMGCEGAYSKTNYEEYYIEFNKSYEHVPPNTGIPELLMGMVIFEHYYNEIGDLLPKFIKICESDVDKRMFKLKELSNQIPQKHKLRLYFDGNRSKHWVINTDSKGKIISACAIDEKFENIELTDMHNKYLENNFKNLKLIANA